MQIHLAFCFCRKNSYLQQMFRYFVSVIYYSVLFVCCLVFQSSNLFYSLLQLSLQNEAHSLLIFFVLCHDG